MTRLLSLNTYNYRRGGSDVVFLEHHAMFRDGVDRVAMRLGRHIGAKLRNPAIEQSPALFAEPLIDTYDRSLAIIRAHCLGCGDNHSPHSVPPSAGPEPTGGLGAAWHFLKFKTSLCASAGSWRSTP